MGKQYNKVIKRRRARAYELRVKERVQQQVIAAVKNTSSTARKRSKK